MSTVSAPPVQLVPRAGAKALALVDAPPQAADEPDLLGLTARRLARALEGDAVAIGIAGERDRTLTQTVWRRGAVHAGAAAESALALSELEQGPVGGCDPLIVADWERERGVARAAVLPPSDMRSSVVCAIRADGDLLGMLAVHARRRAAFDDRDAELVSITAGLLAHLYAPSGAALSSHLDPLTGLTSQSAFEALLASADATRAAVIAVQVDDLLGDEVVRQLALRLSRVVPRGTTVAHFGAGRFMLLAPEVGGELEALSIGTAALQALRTPVLAGDATRRLSASAGIALDGDGRRSADLVRDAGFALRQARELGGDRCELFHTAKHARLLERLRLESELSHALERGEFVVHYQPILAQRTRETIGLEALVRWQHPERGLLLPADFLAVAEESALIVELGSWVLAEVCSQIARWSAEPERGSMPPVTVNVCGRQLDDGTFVSRLAAALLATGIAPASIVVAITGASVTEPERARSAAATLRQSGVKVFLDDFGGGASSLDQLRWLPLDGIRIEREFVRGIDTDTDTLPLIRGIVQIAHGLGLAVIAEGVETEAQLESLRGTGVDAIQGFLVGRPVAPEEVGPAAAGERPDPCQANGELISLGAVATALGVSASTVRRIADQGLLPGVRTRGGHRRFRRSDVEQFARAQRGGAGLRPLVLPKAPLPRPASVLRREGRVLVERAAKGTYDSWRPGWFATEQARANAAAWLQAFAEAVAGGRHAGAIDEAAAYLDRAMLAGATLSECVRFLNQFAVVTSIELARARMRDEEILGVRRLIAAFIEAFLERVTR